MFKLGLEKQRNQRSNCQHLLDHRKSKRVPKKDLHDPDNHNGGIIHLEADILECEVKWALGSITMNKANGGNGIPVELFQILKK